MKILDTAEAVVQGGRRGHGRTTDARLAVDLAVLDLMLDSILHSPHSFAAPNDVQ
jgi:hypothetical protein